MQDIQLVQNCNIISLFSSRSLRSSPVNNPSDLVICYVTTARLRCECTAAVLHNNWKLLGIRFYWIAIIQMDCYQERIVCSQVGLCDHITC